MKNTVKQHLNKRYIAPECRVNEEKDEIDLLLEGKLICLDFEELQDIIGNINKLNINTLLIQKSGWLYYVKVDELTIKAQTCKGCKYNNNKEEQLRCYHCKDRDLYEEYIS
jgi:predicted Zn-ribbon and HTH transcriptional regulator